MEGHSLARPSQPQHPSGVEEGWSAQPRLGLWWEFWCEGSLCRLKEWGEPHPDCPALSQKHSLPLPFPATSRGNDALLPGRRGNRQAQQERDVGSEPIPPCTGTTSQHSQGSSIPGCQLQGRAAAEGQGRLRQPMSMLARALGKLSPCLALHHIPPQLLPQLQSH